MKNVRTLKLDNQRGGYIKQKKLYKLKPCYKKKIRGLVVDNLEPNGVLRTYP